jgi:uncharacterized metal-binding protein YceD (DUF177 family)
MAERPQQKTVIRLADLDPAEGAVFELKPEATQAQMDRLDVTGLRKARFAGRLIPEGKRGWRLEAQLGATVVQPCIVTLEPVVTRIEDKVVRRYVPNYDQIAGVAAEGDGEGMPMPEDDTIDPLPATIDLMVVFEEALSLALPLYPRADGAELGETRFAEKGVAPLEDKDLKPFAGLAGLKDKLENGDPEAE